MDDLSHYFNNYGYWAVFIGSFIDHTGVPAALLLSIGFVISGHFDLSTVLILSLLGAILSDILMYWLGLHGGRPLLNKLFKLLELDIQKVKKTEVLVDKHGGGILVWGRFIAFVSRYIPLVCGVLRMKYHKFIVYTILGNILIILLYGLTYYYLSDMLSKYIEDKNFPIYLSLAIILFQVSLTYVFLKRRKRKLNS